MSETVCSYYLATLNPFFLNMYPNSQVFLSVHLGSAFINKPAVGYNFKVGIPEVNESRLAVGIHEKDAR